MPRNVRSTATQVGEDVTDKAGWMYADLFLALMVIFLATISFVPEFRVAPTSNTGVQGTTVASSQMDKGIQLQYSGFDSIKLKLDVDKFQKEQGMTANSQIVYVQIIGGYTAPKGSPSTATVTAMKFSNQMRAELPELFKRTSFNIDTSPSIPENSVSLRIVFAG